MCRSVLRGCVAELRSHFYQVGERRGFHLFHDLAAVRLHGKEVGGELGISEIALGLTPLGAPAIS